MNFKLYKYLDTYAVVKKLDFCIYILMFMVDML